jgi:hypothetical protein
MTQDSPKSADVKPCWRCGSRAIVEPTPCLPGFYHVECVNTKECNAYGNFGSREQAVEWWNRRALSPPAHADVVERLYHAVALAYTRETGGAEITRRVGEAIVQAVLSATARAEQPRAQSQAGDALITEAMLEAGKNALADNTDVYEDHDYSHTVVKDAAVVAIYLAMLAAATPSKEK